MHWPLFEMLPKLQPRLAPIHLCELPTPVESLPSVGQQAWVKRDDLTHSIYGGNKTRKFEFIASDILTKNAKHLYTIGGTGSNHCVATAMVCQQLGRRCTIITFDQPDSPSVRKNQTLMRHFGAEVINAGSVAIAAGRFFLNPRRLNSDYYFLPGGGATPVATFAYINAAMELKQQIDNNECPEPAGIYVPVGSSSTLAGLTLGCALAGLKTRVIGIQILGSHIGPIETCTPVVGNKMMQRALDAIKIEYPDLELELPSVHLNPDWYEPGYGVLTEATSKAIEQASKAGLLLEQTYSGKTFDAFSQAIATSTQPLLYWATYSSATVPQDMQNTNLNTGLALTEGTAQ